MKEGLVNDFVRAFCEDREGGLWIGTDGGLSYWRAGTFRSFTAATGLIYGSIRGLLLDRDDSLWVATERGLTRFRSGAFVSDPLLERSRQHESLGALPGRRARTVDRDTGLRALPVEVGPADAVHDRSRPAEQQDSLRRGRPAGQPLDERPERRRLGVAARSRVAPSARRQARRRAALRHHRGSEHQSDAGRRPACRRGDHHRRDLVPQHERGGADRARRAGAAESAAGGDRARDRRWPARSVPGRPRPSAG